MGHEVDSRDEVMHSEMSETTSGGSFISFATADVRTSARARAVMQLIRTDRLRNLVWIQLDRPYTGLPPSPPVVTYSLASISLGLTATAAAAAKTLF